MYGDNLYCVGTICIVSGQLVLRRDNLYCLGTVSIM